MAAVGVPSDTDWDAATNYLSTIFPMNMSQRAMMAMIVTYLKRIDGTILLAIRPDTTSSDMDDDLFNAPKISFFIGIELKKDSVKGTLEEIRNMIGLLGLQSTQSGKNEYVWTLPGLSPVTLSTVEGNCIALSNRTSATYGNKSAEKVLKGNSFAIWADIPSGLAGKTYGGLGFNLNVATDDEFNADFSFNGSDVPILEQLALSIAK